MLVAKIGLISKNRLDYFSYLDYKDCHATYVPPTQTNGTSEVEIPQ
jgi:hypothetical protein